MDIDENVLIYIAESKELLEDMEDALLQLERQPKDEDLLNRIFRAAHTIKGSAGLFGFDNIISFTHVAENLLDDIRNGFIPITEELISLLMRAKDHIGSLVAALEDDSVNVDLDGEELLGLLTAYLEGPQTKPKSMEGLEDGCGIWGESNLVSEGGNFHLSVRFGVDSFKEGFDPAAVFRQLRKIGNIVDASLVTDAIPTLSQLDAESCYLGWEIVLNSKADKQEIAEIFEFMDANVHILPPRSRMAEYGELIKQLPEDEAALGQILVDVGTLTPQELQMALNRQKDCGGLMGEILVDDKSVQPEIIKKALKKQEETRSAKQRDLNMVRVDAGKLDKLVNLVGELVIGAELVTQLSLLRQDDELSESVEEMAAALEEMRETALGLRMVPIGNTFNRFHRVVRDTAKEIGKEIRLNIEGAETELDKTVIDRINDPLTHLIRNAIDHGIEEPKERLKAGKSAEGSILLNAYHETGMICIEIADDGRGLNVERIRDVATERGLISDSKNLSKSEIYKLIFEPGFSTADHVNNISGRGVGMDVVNRNIEALRGEVEIDSTEGQGTRVLIRLPLTLAIIDGFHISVADESFIIPLEAVVECVTLSNTQRTEAQHRNYINLRDEVLPLIRLRTRFGLAQSSSDDCRRQNVVVVKYGNKKAGLVVDVLHGDAQAVIKPLGHVFNGLSGFAGFTILGRGQVALIMDVSALIKQAEKRKCEDKAQSDVKEPSMDE